MEDTFLWELTPICALYGIIYILLFSSRDNIWAGNWRWHERKLFFVKWEMMYASSLLLSLYLKCFWMAQVLSTVALYSVRLSTVCPESSIIILFRSKKIHGNELVGSHLGFWKLHTALRLLLKSKDLQLLQKNSGDPWNAWAAENVSNNESQLIAWKYIPTERQVNL